MSGTSDSASPVGEVRRPPTADEVENLITDLFRYYRQNRATGIQDESGQQFEQLQDRLLDVDHRLGNVLDSYCPPGFSLWDQPWIEMVCALVSVPVPDPKPRWWIG